MRKMRLTIIALLLLVSTTSIMAEEVQMNRKQTAGTTHGPQRMPSNNSVVLTAFYAEDSGILDFNYSVPETSFTYCIYDENDAIISYGNGLFDSDGTWSGSVGLLPSGNYTIEVVIGDVVYCGELNL